MIARKILVTLRWAALAFCVLSLWGWLVRFSFTAGDQLGTFGKYIKFIARFPQLVKEAFTQDFGAKNPLYIDNRFPEIKDFEQVGFNNNKQYLLVTRYSEQHNQPVTQLIHLSNHEVIHEWVLDYDELFAKLDQQEIAVMEKVGRLNDDKKGFDKFTATPQHAFLNEDFSIVFNMTRGPLVCLDSLSEIKWFVGGDFHHTVEKDHEGNYWVPAVDHHGKYARAFHIRDDVLRKISPEGKVLYAKSVLNIFVENGYRAYVFGAYVDKDPVHLNDIQPVLYDSKYWKKGDLFISMRTGSTVFLYRPSTNKIIWMRRGPWLNQHDVDILDSARISVFGNDVLRKRGEIGDFPTEYFSKNNNIYIHSFLTDSAAKPYADVFENHQIKTPTQGLAQVQPNGHVYVEETDFGRHLMIDETGLAWQFVDLNSGGEVLYSAWSRLLVIDADGKFTE